MQGVVYKKNKLAKTTERINKILASPNLRSSVYLRQFKYICEKSKEAEFNKGCAHSLWGVIPGLPNGNIDDYEKACEIIKAEGKRTYIGHAEISLDADTADAKDMNCRKNWQAFIDKNIHSIAKEYGIDINNFCYGASFHFKAGHPHAHIMFWDKSDKICNNIEFMPKERFVVATDKIKECFGKDLFANELKLFYKEQDSIKQSFKEDLEQALKLAALAQNNISETEQDELTAILSDEATIGKIDCKLSTTTLKDNLLCNYYDKLVQVKNNLPKTGRLNYAFLPPETKQIVDEATDALFQAVPAFALKYDNLIKSVKNVTKLYGSSDDGLAHNCEAVKKQLYKTIGNMTLKHIINNLNDFNVTDFVVGDDKTKKEDLSELVFLEDEKITEKKQYNKGITFYKKAKVILEKGDEIIKEDIRLLTEYLIKAADDYRYEYAQYKLGRLYLEGKLFAKDVKLGLDYLLKAAKQDNQYAQYSLGKLYLSGEDVTKDVTLGLDYLLKAAKQDNQYAQYSLGKLYLAGEDVTKDVKLGLDYLLKAAKQDNQYAQYSLGKLYLSGEDVTKDVTLGLDYLIKAANQDNQYAKYSLGKLFIGGSDVPQNVSLGLTYLQEAAQQGNQSAKYTIGKLFIDGTVVPEDVEFGLKCLQEAAQQGNQFAQYTLGKELVIGRICEKNEEYGNELLTKAAEQGNQFAAAFLKNSKDFETKMKINTSVRLVVQLSRLFENRNWQKYKDRALNNHKDKSLTQLRNLKIINAGKSGMNWGEEYDR